MMPPGGTLTLPIRTLYEQVLAAVGKGGLPAPKPPRPSASVVLWRTSGRGLEVFWIQRAETMAFMGGWHAFPGGGLSRRDLDVAVDGEPRGAYGRPGTVAMPETLIEGLADPPPHLVPGLVACTLRELLEETGVLPVPELFAREHGSAAILEGKLAAARRTLLAERRGLGEVAAEQGLPLYASHLVFAGRWLTPPLGPIRYDNRFFLLEWPEDLPVQPLVVPGEAQYGEWIAPGEAWRRWARGEVLAAPPILHILKVLAEDGPDGGLPRLREPAEANLGPYRRVEFRPGVVLLPLATATLPPATHTNAFLFGRGERVLVDPGSANREEIERLTAAVQAVQEEGGKVVAIWLTHHHPDHIGGVAALREGLRIPVAAHPDTASRVAAAGITVDRELHDSQRIVLAGDPPFPVRVIHTPGHARGHLCFLDEDGRSLLAGDMLSAVSTIVVDPPEGDMDDYLDSLQKLIDQHPKTLFPAHGPPVAAALAKLGEFIEHRLWREGKILEAWEEGVRTVDELLPRVYDDVPEIAWPLAKRQIEAHLIRLRRAGKVE